MCIRKFFEVAKMSENPLRWFGHVQCGQMRPVVRSSRIIDKEADRTSSRPK